MASPELTKLSIDNSPISSIDANKLANPIVQPKVTPPQVGTLPGTGTVGAVRTESDNIITAQTAEAERLQELRSQMSAISEQGSLSDLFSTQQEAFGIPEDLKRLKDINLQLAEMDTASELQKSQIEGAAGQTIGQAQREVSQEDREAAIRSAGLAAQAAVLQGNIETGTALVNQAVNIAYQDRTLTNTNLINQINDLRGTVDDQTQQLLDQEQRKYEADQAAIEEVKAAVNEAMVSGATAQEAAQLSDPRLTDEQRLQLAQGIVARGATELRDLDRQVKQSTLSTQALQREKLQKDIDTVLTGFLTGKDKFDSELQLAKEFNNRTKDYSKAAIQIGNIRASFEKAKVDSESGKSINATSQGVLVAFQKLLDPTSVVRESEYARSGDGLSLVSRLDGQFAKIKQGGAGVTASDLEEFVLTGETFLRGYEDSAIDQAQLIINQASPVGLDVRNIVPNGVLNLMEDRFIEGVENTPIGGTFTIGDVTYKKLSEDEFEPT